MASRLQCCTAGYFMQPVAHQPTPAQRGRPAYQHKKNCLKAIFRISLVVENAPANSQNHRPVPPNQCLEGIVVSPADEKPQQFSIAGRVAVMEPGLPQKMH